MCRAKEAADPYLVSDSSQKLIFKVEQVSRQ